MDASNLRSNENCTQTEGSKENIIEIEIPYTLFQYLSSEECNLQNICRICLSVNDPVLYPLFSSKENSVLSNMFMTICEVQITEDDGLPSNICPGCQAEVINYYEFKIKCVRSDYTLKSVLKGEFVPKEDYSKFYNNAESRKREENVDNESNKTENDLNPIESKVTVQETEIDYLDNLKESLRDDEALCIVRDTTNNEKEITILDNDSKTIVSQEGIKKTKKKVKHYCSFCPKKFHKVKSLKAHISKHHATLEPQSAFPCKQCKESFDSEFDLKVHGILHNQKSEEKKWKCTECQKVFNGRPALRRHLQRHMQMKRFPCVRCGKAFVEMYALRRHARVHTGEGPEKKHACHHCDKRFAHVGALSAHMSRHGGVRGCVCAQCGASFPSARLLASHARVHSSDKPYACDYCGKRFRHESTRNTHHRTHTGERPFVCAQCGKTFIQKSNLTLHMRTHTGEKPYSCTLCDRKFSSGSTLKAHKRTHTGEKPYSCKICGKSFARLNMKQHMRCHSGERAFSCPACHKRFTTQHGLRDHYRLHTGEKPFECAKCTEKFTTKSRLIKHVKKHEKKKKATKKVMLTPVTVSDKNLQSSTNVQPEKKSDEYVFVDLNKVTNVPNNNQANLCTVHEIPIQPAQELIYQDEGDIKTNVIVLDNNPNLVTNGVSYVNDVNYTNDVKLVTVNEGEVSISATSATMEGTTVKLYQYDQSLLQIHTGGGQLTISRISSKMTTNF